MATKCTLVSLVIRARGTTTVFTAEASVDTITATPASTANTWATITRQLCNTLSR
jgi:hypothetical protein